MNIQQRIFNPLLLNARWNGSEMSNSVLLSLECINCHYNSSLLKVYGLSWFLQEKGNKTILLPVLTSLWAYSHNCPNWPPLPFVYRKIMLQIIHVNAFTFAHIPKDNCVIYFLDFEYEINTWEMCLFQTVEWLSFS